MYQRHLIYPMHINVSKWVTISNIKTNVSLRVINLGLENVSCHDIKPYPLSVSFQAINPIANECIIREDKPKNVQCINWRMNPRGHNVPTKLTHHLAVYHISKYIT